MKIKAIAGSEEKVKSDLLILPLFKDNNSYGDLTSSIIGIVEGLIKKGIFKAELNEVYPLTTTEAPHPLILLTGLGEREKINGDRLRQAGGSAGSFCRQKSIKSISLSTANLRETGLLPDTFVEGFLLSTYMFGKYKSENGSYCPELKILSKDRALKSRLPEIEAQIQAVFLCRDLVNTPSNDLTPDAFAKQALKLKSRKVSVKVLTEKQIASAGMDAYLAVAKGSKNPPRFIEIRYRGGSKKSVVLIGKSITFDSGGISIKPSSGMEKMKYDMAGGAAVIGIIKAAELLKLPVNLIGLLPAAENMPGGSATRPGDIVSTISGKTIEIANTDAEGRLALADAIEYAKRFDPEFIIDIATLTGACAIALGNEAAAAMSNSEELIKDIVKASEATGEKVWPMPLYEEYREYLKSEVADIRNVGTDRAGSLVTAGYFLKEFAEDIPWLHIDIASIAWTDKDRPYCPKGATGFGVRLVTRLLRNLYQK
ncbi:MAG: leucyl aminopeptidase [Nitrospirae bacterium]|nr:leucyl aminopeptidase [Nitrospirota bacterium]